jgi:hypothetical protein
MAGPFIDAHSQELRPLGLDNDQSTCRNRKASPTADRKLLAEPSCRGQRAPNSMPTLDRDDPQPTEV